MEKKSKKEFAEINNSIQIKILKQNIYKKICLLRSYMLNNLSRLGNSTKNGDYEILARLNEFLTNIDKMELQTRQSNDTELLKEFIIQLDDTLSNHQTPQKK